MNLQQLVIGLTLGSIYALIALGYTMVYGVLRLINFAHGDIYMLGAFFGFYTTGWLTEKGWYFGATAIPASPDLALLHFLNVLVVFVVAMVGCALAGMLIERLAYRPLRDSPRLTTLITAIGVSMLLEYGGQAIFSPDPQSFPHLMPANPVINTPRLTISQDQLTIVVLSFLMMAALQWIVSRTRFGRAMRAVSLDPAAATLMGINIDSVISVTFAIGSALAAAAGILTGVYQHTIDPLMGLNAGLKAFVAAVLGGIGSIPGAVFGGLLMGVAENIVVALGKSEYKDAIAFALLIVVLLVRPAGLFGRIAVEKV